MSFEKLPNEILLDTFGYLNGLELLCAFYGLNSRLNFLLRDQFRSCSFKFHSISKRNFDMICRQHFPTMAGCMPTLQLSDSEETPTLIAQFLFYMPSFHLFTELHTLSISYLRSSPMLMRVIEQCHRLDSLTHLHFLHCYIQENPVDYQSMVNHIWRLPKLLHCTMDIGVKGQLLFCTPTVISPSLESVTIETSQMTLQQINQLHQQTPNLQFLCVSIVSFGDPRYASSPLPNLIQLHVYSVFACDAARMDVFLQNTPNLRHLSIDLTSELVDGDQWERIIRTHLSKLELFRLKMKRTFPAGFNIQERVDEMIDSFRTPFWIDEHQWFVRCLISNRTIHACTVPQNYDDELPVSYRSTHFDDDQQNFYQSVTKITSPTFFEQPISSPIRLLHIEHLSINLPINDQFWSIMANFDRLKSLEILFHANTFQNQVQALLNRATHLNKICIKQHESTPLQSALFKYTNASVRDFDLRNINHYFTAEECLQFSRAPFGLQCERLSILVSNWKSILSLVRNMPKLRILNVRCQIEKFNSLSTSMKDHNFESANSNQVDEDHYVQRLRSHLPSTCVIMRDPKCTCDILIWL